MRKRIKILLLVLFAVGIALSITRLSSFVAVGKNPNVYKTQAVCGRAAPDSLTPIHTYGLPIPYVIGYSGNPTCGFSEEVSHSRFVIDTVFWLLAVIAGYISAKYLKRI